MNDVTTNTKRAEQHAKQILNQNPHGKLLKVKEVNNGDLREIWETNDGYTERRAKEIGEPSEEIMRFNTL